MMRSLIAIAALVAFVPAKAGAPSGEVDGKGIICHSEESVTGEPEWYWFAQKRVTQSYIEIYGTTAEVLLRDLGEYETTPTSVKWYASRSYELDRKSLIYWFVDGNGLWGSARCEIADTWEVLRDSIETFKIRRQQAIDEQAKGNKI